jgi:hypothetical protein
MAERPGDPAGMSAELRLQLQPLFEADGVRVRQFREPLEMLVGFDQPNKYEVRCASTGRLFGTGGSPLEG